MKVRFGVPWYGPGDWRALRAAAVDPDELESSYEDWLRLSSMSCAELCADGIDVARIHVDADELIRWCSEQAIPLDAQARTRFASLKFARGAPPRADARQRSPSLRQDALEPRIPVTDGSRLQPNAFPQLRPLRR